MHWNTCNSVYLHSGLNTNVIKAKQKSRTSKVTKRSLRFKSGEGCRFNKECAYIHEESKPDEEQNELKEITDNLKKEVFDITNKFNIEAKKVEQMEKVVKAMCRKVLCLESEIESIMNNNIPDECAREPGVSEVLESKENETENVKNQYDWPLKQQS